MKGFPYAGKSPMKQVLEKETTGAPIETETETKPKKYADYIYGRELEYDHTTPGGVKVYRSTGAGYGVSGVENLVYDVANVLGGVEGADIGGYNVGYNYITKDGKTILTGKTTEEKFWGAEGHTLPSQSYVAKPEE